MLKTQRYTCMYKRYKMDLARLKCWRGHVAKIQNHHNTCNIPITPAEYFNLYTTSTFVCIRLHSPSQGVIRTKEFLQNECCLSRFQGMIDQINSHRPPIRCTPTYLPSLSLVSTTTLVSRRDYLEYLEQCPASVGRDVRY